MTIDDMEQVVKLPMAQQLKILQSVPLSDRTKLQWLEMNGMPPEWASLDKESFLRVVTNEC